MKEINLKVKGMTCHHCVKKVSEALRGVNGIISADVDLDDGIAYLETDEQVFDIEFAKKAVLSAGYYIEDI
ncbi:MAG: heavy-metal-associated domain-containing protein [Calditrichaceae bacterium]